MANYRIVAEWNLPNGGIAQNVLYARVDDGETADQADLITDIGNEVLRIFTPWLANVAINVILALVRVYVFDPLTGVSTPVGVDTLNNTGGGTAQMLPAGTAVKINTYLPGRSRPFGAYLTGVDETGALNDGLMNSTMQAGALATALESGMTETMVATGLLYRPRFYSPKDKALLGATGAEHEVNDVFDYQRRRKQGVGV